MTMAKQTRYLFDLSDIRAIRLHCNSCEGEAVQSVEGTKFPGTCPLCLEDWEINSPNGVGRDNWQLVRTMKVLVNAVAQNPKMTIRFEIDGDSADKAT